MSALARVFGARRVPRPPRSARRAHARARTTIARAALRSEKSGWGPDERRTVILGVLATASTVAVVVVEVGRVWRRGSAPMPSEADDVLQAAEEAVVETIEATLAGYQDVSVRENATFMLLTSFVTTFASARGIAFLLRGRGTVGPFRDLIVGRRHIHHFVPGIALLMLAGAAAILSENEEIEPRLAVPFGIGMGLTLDESALLLELDDVYWSPEGLLGVQITLAVVALFGALALGVRFARRGEEIVLEVDGPTGTRHGVAATGYRPAQRRLGPETPGSGPDAPPAGPDAPPSGPNAPPPPPPA